MQTPYLPPTSEVLKIAPEAALLSGSPITGQGAIENLDVIVDPEPWSTMLTF